MMGTLLRSFITWVFDWVFDSLMDEYGFISPRWIVKEVSSFASTLKIDPLFQNSRQNCYYDFHFGIEINVVDGGSLVMSSSNIK